MIIYMYIYIHISIAFNTLMHLFPVHSTSFVPKDFCWFRSLPSYSWWIRMKSWSSSMSISCRSRRPVAQSWVWNAAVRLWNVICMRCHGPSQVMMLDFGAKGTLLALLWTAWMGSPASVGLQICTHLGIKL